jgi:hypothetical protein
VEDGGGTNATTRLGDPRLASLGHRSLIAGVYASRPVPPLTASPVKVG